MDPLLAAAAKGANRHSHLLSPYIFSLPADILSALQLRKIGAATPAAASSPAQTSDAEGTLCALGMLSLLVSRFTSAYPSLCRRIVSYNVSVVVL